MERMLRRFSPDDCRQWWEREGVNLVVQDDECIFPQSQNAMEVVDTLLRLMKQLDVRLVTEARVERIEALGDACEVHASRESGRFDAVVVTTGGSPRREGLDFLSPLDLRIESSVPSLYALNVGDQRLRGLSGTVVQLTSVGIAGTRYKAEGPLLLTHFGLSGPAILRLSSHAARYLAERAYRVTLLVNWMEGRTEAEVGTLIDAFRKTGKLVGNEHPDWLTSRLWTMLLERAGVAESLRWDALNTKERNRLVATLTADAYPTDGRRTYKGEFVTCGGIALKEIDPKTMSLRRFPRVFVAGEVTDVDGVTGGFNLQAAWSMGWVAAQGVAASLSDGAQ